MKCPECGGLGIVAIPQIGAMPLAWSFDGCPLCRGVGNVPDPHVRPVRS